MRAGRRLSQYFAPFRERSDYYQHIYRLLCAKSAGSNFENRVRACCQSVWYPRETQVAERSGNEGLSQARAEVRHAENGGVVLRERVRGPLWASSSAVRGSKCILRSQKPQISRSCWAWQFFSGLNQIAAGEGQARANGTESPSQPSTLTLTITNRTWPGGVGCLMVTALDSLLKKSRVRLPDVPLSDNNLGQLVPVSLSSIISYRSRSGDAVRLGR